MTSMDTRYAGRLEAGRAAEMAEEFGLHRIGTRPSIGAYIRSIWGRRQFIGTLAWSKAYAQNRNTFLGQAWLVINPLLWAAVYYTVFGLGLRTSRDSDNFVAFLVIGVFMFRHMSSCVSGGAKAITGNIPLLRSLHFPRAVMPISVVLTELILLLPGLVLMFAIVGGSAIWVESESPSVTWLLVPLGLLLMSMFTTGVAMIMARLVVESRDIGNLVPFLTRAAFYVSGIFFSIEERFHGTVGAVMASQPFAVYLEVFRGALMKEIDVKLSTWLLAGGWAVLFLVVGFVFFWHGEEKYGRD